MDAKIVYFFYLIKIYNTIYITNNYFVHFSPFFQTETLVSRISIQRVLDVSTEWTDDQSNSSHSVLVYGFRVTCDPHYYGSGCSNVCRPRDDPFGHYTCSTMGDRVCISGWTGDYCTVRKYYFVFLLYL